MMRGQIHSRTPDFDFLATPTEGHDEVGQDRLRGHHVREVQSHVRSLPNLGGAGHPMRQ